MAGVSKVIFDGEVLIDLTSDTVNRDALAEGSTAHMRDGTRITGRVPVNTSGEDHWQGLVQVTTWDIEGTTLVISVSALDTSPNNYNVLSADALYPGNQPSIHTTS